MLELRALYKKNLAEWNTRKANGFADEHEGQPQDMAVGNMSDNDMVPIRKRRKVMSYREGSEPSDEEGFEAI